MKVLIATDGSVYAQAALESIIERRWSADSAFLVLHVVESLEHNFYDKLPGSIDDPSATRHALANNMVQQTVTLLKHGLSDKPVSGVVRTGSIVQTIIQAALEWHSDLIILGHRGLTGKTKAHLGSVSEQVACKAPCSVEVIHYNLPRSSNLEKAKIFKTLTREQHKQ